MSVVQEEKKPALSISAMDTLSRCGEQYRRRYIEREIIPPGVALLVGRGVDASVDKNLTHKITTEGALLTTEEVTDTARDAFVREWSASEIALSEEELQDGIEKTKDAGIDKTVRLARLHSERLAPVIRPTAVQRKWRIALPNYPMDLIGKTDIEEVDAVRDTKTSGKSPRENEADLSNQLTLYALARRVLDRATTMKVALDYLVDLKKPRAVTVESTRDDEDFRVMLRRIEVAMRAIEQGVFVPAAQTEWFCNLRWCGYARTCAYFRGRKTVVIGFGREDEKEGENQ